MLINTRTVEADMEQPESSCAWEARSAERSTTPEGAAAERTKGVLQYAHAYGTL